MNFSVLPSNLPIPSDDGKCKHLLNSIMPEISLPNQYGNLLNLNRSETFRLVIYFYPMTGNPVKALPKNWNKTPGARGCTPQTCSFRDNYDKLTALNAVPIGISSQSLEDIDEMTKRLKVPFDVLSDENFILSKKMKLPIFQIENKTYIKRITIIVHQTRIKKVFYPVFPPDLHINDVIKWLEDNQ